MLVSVLSLLLSFSLSARAEDVSTSQTSLTEMGPVKVIGSSQEELHQPNSAHFISKEKLEQQQQTDVTRVLKQVPGVYVQEEDGMGLRPNIGLRGTHPHRSKKIVLLEDGILIGPAPYSAPAAYYTPYMSKIESLEVFKGVASVPYGPNSVGGAINYLTRSIPNQTQAELEVGGGSYDYQKYRGNGAYVWDTGGVMIEGTHAETEGFKKLDSGDPTGFSKNDFLLKGVQRLGGPNRAELQWKLGYGTEMSDETYLGLTLNDFDSSPYRRYSASQNDQMNWDHEQYQLTYKVQPNEAWALWATGYHNRFHRNWSRFNNFRNTTVNVGDVLRNPTSGSNGTYYDILTGAADSSSAGGNNGDIVIDNNNRYYYSEGIQLNSFSMHPWGSTVHQASLGLRLHQDQIHRDHTEDLYSMTNKKMVRTADARSQTADNIDQTTAVTFTAADEIQWEAWKFTVSNRWETLSYKHEDDLTGDSSPGSETVFVPGVGALRQFSDQMSGFVGVNKGAAVVGPGQKISGKQEQSMNYEAGMRYQNPDREFFAEAIFFYADYQNIKDTCSFSSGCTGATLDQDFDGGKAKISGLEMRIAQGFQYQNVYFPVNFNTTLTKAQFAEDSYSENPDWGVGDIKNGDPMPYVPEAQYSLSLGTQYRKYSQDIVLSWTSKMYDQAVDDPETGNAREEIPGYGVVDWSSKYQYSKQAQVYARFDNIFDNEYLVSLRPFGARPGKARSVAMGVKYLF